MDETEFQGMEYTIRDERERETDALIEYLRAKLVKKED